MPSVLYPKGKAHILGLSTKADLIADTIKAMLISSVTTPYNNTHEFVSDLVAGGIIARSAALSSKAVTSGIFTAANYTQTAVSGSTIDSIIGFKDTGADATSVLLWWMDVTPFGPTGGDIAVTWNGSGIFAI